MTKAQMERIVKDWLPRLGLERWQVKIDFTVPSEDENYAQVVKSSFYDTATIRLEKEWKSWKPPFATQILVHELIHLVHRDVDEAFFDLEGQIPGDAWVLAEKRYRNVVEQFVDRTASRLIDLAS